MADANIRADATQFIDNILRSTEVMKQFTDEERKAAVIAQTLNSATGKFLSTLKLQNAEGTRLNASITSYGNELEKARIKVTGTSNAIDVLAKSLNQSTVAAGSASTAVTEFTLSWKSVIRIIEGTVVRNVFYELADNIRQSVDNSKELAIQIAQIQTISESNMGLDQWQRGIIAISDATGLIAKDVASGIYDTLSNQIADGAEALQFATTAAKFAVATNSTYKDSVDVISSALNSYNLNVSEASRVSDVFFRLIDLGRTTAPEFANSIGRVLPLAKELGVTLEEVSAFLSVTTRAGNTTANAMTQLTNVFSRLLKPKTDLKEFLHSIGAESGQAAIEIYGFVGVMQKLNDFINKQPDVAAKLFPDIRGLRGVLSVTSSNMQAFVDDAKAMRESTGAVGEAMTKFADNPGKKFQIEMNKIQNLFTQDFGQNAIKAFNAINDNVLSVNEALGAMSVAALAAGGTAGVGYLVQALGSLNLALQTANTGLGALVLAKNPVLATAAAVAVVVGLEYKYFKSRQDAIDRALDQQEELRQSWLTYNRVLTDKDYNDASEFIDKLSSTLMQKAASNIAKINEELNQFEKGTNGVLANKTLLADFKSANDAFDRSLQKTKESIKNAISETERSIKSAEKFLKEEPVNLRQKITLERIDKEEDAYKKIQLINAEIERLASEQVTDSDILVKNYKDIQALIEKAKDSQVAAGKEDVKSLKQQESLQRRLQQEEQRLANLQAKSGISKTSTASQKLSYNQLQQQIASSQQKINDYKQQLDSIAITSMSQLNIDKSRQRVLDYYTRKLTELKDKQESALRIEQNYLTTYEDSIQKIKETQDDLEKFKLDKLTVADTDEKFNTMYKEADDALTKYRQQVLEIAGDDFEKRKTVIDKIMEMEARLKDIRLKYNEKVVQEKAIEESKALKTQQEAELNAAKERENAARATLTNTIAYYMPKLKELLKGTYLEPYLNEIIRGDLTKFAQNLQSGLSVNKKELSSRYSGYNYVDQSSVPAVSAIIAKIQSTVGPVLEQQKASQDMADQLKETNSKLDQQLGPARAQVDLAQQQVAATLSVRDRLDAILNTIQAQPIIERKAFGGPIHGTDTIPAMLSPGEFVVNAASTRKFYSQLVAMNGARGYAQGGYVTNVGDVHIAMTSTGKTESDIVAIGKGLRREIRRGRIRL